MRGREEAGRAACDALTRQELAHSGSTNRRPRRAHALHQTMSMLHLVSASLRSPHDEQCGVRNSASSGPIDIGT